MKKILFLTLAINCFTTPSFSSDESLAFLHLDTPPYVIPLEVYGVINLSAFKIQGNVIAILQSRYSSSVNKIYFAGEYKDEAGIKALKNEGFEESKESQAIWTRTKPAQITAQH